MFVRHTLCCIRQGNTTLEIKLNQSWVALTPSQLTIMHLQNFRSNCRMLVLQVLTEHPGWIVIFGSASSLRMKADLKVCSQGLHIFLLSLLLARGSIYLCLVMFLLPSFSSLHTLGGVFAFFGPSNFSRSRFYTTSCWSLHLFTFYLHKCNPINLRPYFYLFVTAFSAFIIP